MIICILKNNLIQVFQWFSLFSASASRIIMRKLNCRISNTFLRKKQGFFFFLSWIIKEMFWLSDLTLLERPFLLLTVYNSSLSLPAPYLPKFSWEHFLKKPLTNFFAVWYYIILIEVNKTYGDISMGAQIPDPSINLKFLIIKRAWVLIWKSGCQVLMSSHFQQSFFKRTDQGRSSALQAKIKIAQGRLQSVALLAPCSLSFQAGW